MKQCHQCGTSLSLQARYCSHCGAPQYQPLQSGERRRLDLEQPLEPQLNRLFFAGLRRHIDEEQPGSDLDRYIERLYEYGFFETVRLRAGQLAEEIRRGIRESGADENRINRQVDDDFDDLTDYFLIHHCKDINPVPLPEAILKYQQKKLFEIDLNSLVLDYLDLEHEEEDYFLSSGFLAMPADKLRNAGKSFLFPEKDEKIFLICDQSLLGNCREGFAFTGRALYWKANLQKARRVAYAGIREVKREKDWIVINGYFFHVNLSLDVKILKLLRRLKRLYA